MLAFNPLYLDEQAVLKPRYFQLPMRPRIVVHLDLLLLNLKHVIGHEHFMLPAAIRVTRYSIVSFTERFLFIYRIVFRPITN